MNRLYETGLMLTVFIIAINAFLTIAGPELYCAGLSGSNMVNCKESSLLPIAAEYKFTSEDVNTVIAAGQGVAKSGNPFTDAIGFLFQGATGIGSTVAKVAGFVTAYGTVLAFVLPSELSFLAVIVTIIFTAVQFFTFVYFFMTVISIIRGGGA
jgi:hypothetical protein